MSTASSSPLPGWLAATVVFGSSAATLVVEVVALRLLAPYLGLTLETSTAVIALALAAIAIGSWTGGRLADRVAPRAALVPLLAIPGVAVAFTPVAVRAAGSVGNGWLLIATAAASIIVPGVLLAAVTPMVTKLQLRHLTETGSVVGRLSGIGTTGAILGTVGTGFVLISRVPVSGIMIGLGVLLVAGSVALGVGLRGLRSAVVPAILLLLSGVVTALTPGQCDAETSYHCASVVTDPQNATGRILILDGAGHSYVDLTDPTHLEFAYVRALAAAVDATFAAGAPLQGFHLGAGGLTLPRYLAATRPRTRSLVAEIDPGVVRLDRERLGPVDPSIDIEVEDGRLGLRALAPASQDLVVGDAFGGVSVPWHLTTREAVTDVSAALRPDGIYVLNVIDHPPLAFARAEVATVAAVFPYVAVAAAPASLAGTGGGNLVVMAAHQPIAMSGISTRLAGRGLDWQVADGAAMDRWRGGAEILTDDHAPVDQLLTPYRTR